MPIILTIGEVLRSFGERARYVGDTTLLRRRPASVTTDSRTCRSEALFFALKGEHFDGHHFIDQVFEKQALAAVVNEAWAGSQKKLAGNFLVVEDTLLALQQLATTIRQRWGKKLVAITGSNGKTTTKEMVASTLAQKMFVHKNTGNLNNHIGLPLTLTAISHGHDVAVVEIGANHFNEIARLSEIAAPDMGLITNVARAHIEFFGSLDGVVKAKQELFQYLRRHDGIAFLNVDDDNLTKANPSGLKTVTFGFNRPAQIHGEVVGIDSDGHATIKWRKGKVRLNLPGMHNASNALAAVAVGDFMGVEAEKIADGIANCEILGQRMQVTQFAGMTIINDAYNANPDSMRVALDFLTSVPVTGAGRRVAILGDMLELGEAAIAAHRELGEHITTLPIQAVLAYGPNMKHLVAAIAQRCWALHFETKEALAAEANLSLRAGDVLLVKGSRGMAMETVLDQIQSRPHD